jgi:LysM repeat protein
MRLILTLALILGAAVSNAAPRGNLEQEMMELRHSLGTIRYELDNRDAESAVLQERLLNQEQTIEQMREDMAVVKKEATVKQSQSLDKLDSNLGTLVTDIKQMRNHSNEMSEALAKAQTRIGQLEKTIETQNRNISNLQSAIKDIMDAFDMKASTGSTTASTGDSADGYRVKAGDSLEKIARKNNISLKRLKEINGLSNDVIRVGQKLRLND